MTGIIINPPTGFSFVDLELDYPAYPLSSLVAGVSGLKKGDQLVFETTATRKEGGSGTVSVGPAGIPSIEGLKGQYTFDFYLVDSSDWLKSEQPATATVGPDVIVSEVPTI